MVGFLRIEKFGFGNFLGRAVRSERLKKTARVAGVARAADLLDFKEQGVCVAIDAPSDHALGVAAGLALEPVFLPGAAPVVHEASVERGLQRGGVHPREHEHAFAFSVLHDGGDETVGIVFECREHELGKVAGNEKPEDSGRRIFGLGSATQWRRLAFSIRVLNVGPSARPPMMRRKFHGGVIIAGAVPRKGNVRRGLTTGARGDEWNDVSAADGNYGNSHPLHPQFRGLGVTAAIQG